MRKRLETVAASAVAAPKCAAGVVPVWSRESASSQLSRDDDGDALTGQVGELRQCRDRGALGVRLPNRRLQLAARVVQAGLEAGDPSGEDGYLIQRVTGHMLRILFAICGHLPLQQY